MPNLDNPYVKIEYHNGTGRTDITDHRLSDYTTTFLELWCEQRKQCWSKLGKGSILLFLDEKVGTGLVVFPEITPTFRERRTFITAATDTLLEQKIKSPEFIFAKGRVPPAVVAGVKFTPEDTDTFYERKNNLPQFVFARCGVRPSVVSGVEFTTEEAETFYEQKMKLPQFVFAKGRFLPSVTSVVNDIYTYDLAR